MDITRGDRRNRYTQEWLDSNSLHLQPIERSRCDDEGEEEGLAARLYRLCQHALRHRCAQERSERGGEQLSSLLKEELTILYLWGQNYGSGELDTALEYSDDARYAVLDALRNLGRALLQGKGLNKQHSCLTLWRVLQMRLADMQTTGSMSQSSLLGPKQAQELKYVVEQAETIMSARNDEVEEESSDCSSDIDEESLSEDEENDDEHVVSKIRSQIRHLVDLSATVQQNLLYTQRYHAKDHYPPVVPFRLSSPAKIYASIIREKYHHAQDQLVDRLGECNWQRHQSVRENMEKMHSCSKDESAPRVDVDPSTKEIEEPYSVFRPYSAFHDSGLGTSVPTQTQYAPSHTSFQSSNSEYAQGSVRVPPTPEEVGTGKSFQCSICGSTLANIRNRVDWK